MFHYFLCPHSKQRGTNLKGRRRRRSNGGKVIILRFHSITLWWWQFAPNPAPFLKNFPTIAGRLFGHWVHSKKPEEDQIDDFSPHETNSLMESSSKSRLISSLALRMGKTMRLDQALKNVNIIPHTSYTHIAIMNVTVWTIMQKQHVRGEICVHENDKG